MRRRFDSFRDRFGAVQRARKGGWVGRCRHSAKTATEIDTPTRTNQKCIQSRFRHGSAPIFRRFRWIEPNLAVSAGRIPRASARIGWRFTVVWCRHHNILLPYLNSLFFVCAWETNIWMSYSNQIWKSIRYGKPIQERRKIWHNRCNFYFWLQVQLFSPGFTGNRRRSSRSKIATDGLLYR